MGHKTQSDIAMILSNVVGIDKDGAILEVGDSVQVDEVGGEHMDFLGTVDSLRGAYIVVEDMEGDCFCFSSEDLELVPND